MLIREEVVDAVVYSLKLIYSIRWVISTGKLTIQYIRIKKKKVAWLTNINLGLNVSFFFMTITTLCSRNLQVVICYADWMDDKFSILT